MVSDRRGLGERLKRQRERRGVTLQKISQSSKVPVSLFAGLEAGDCSRWPAGLYARAYVRAYAEAIGLNQDETVEEFLVAFGAAIKADGIDGPSSSARTANPLRLTLVEESPIELDGLGRRAALAATDLLIGSLIAAIASVGLGLGVWITAGLILSYFTLGRLISDDPLLYHVYRRLRTRPATPAVAAEEDASDEVAPVGDAASTAA
jgi:transcriptional regulator with XRE-family HTH domain